jgi:hypothetical protein
MVTFVFLFLSVAHAALDDGRGGAIGVGTALTARIAIIKQCECRAVGGSNLTLCFIHCTTHSLSHRLI